MKHRKIIDQITDTISKPEKKIIFIWGPRQTGKSTILNYLYRTYGGAYFNFDDLDDQRLFTPHITRLKSVIKLRNKNESKYIFIDEIQKNPGSTQAVKLLADTTDFIIIATGSSELRSKTQYFDTLAGRYKEYILFPLTIDEMALFKDDSTVGLTDKPDTAECDHFSKYLEEMMIYGSYPYVVLTKNKIEELKNITQNSIVKDIVNIYDLKNTDLIYNLLRLLSMQIGNLVNVTELTSSLRSNRITIDNYLSILHKNRIIFFLEPFKTNKRKGYLERKKVYFYDTGIRNSLIEDFRPLYVRTDSGALFENLVITGALRQTFYRRNNNKLYYYREIAGAQKELDLIIESTKGERSGFEMKYHEGKINKFSDLRITNYKIITQSTAPMFLV